MNTNRSKVYSKKEICSQDEIGDSPFKLPNGKGSSLFTISGVKLGNPEIYCMKF